MRIVNLENNNRKIISTINNFHVLEYVQDASVSPMNAIDEYFMSKMNVRRRQVVIDISREHSAVIQAGAMQWMGGNVQATSGVKGLGDLFGKAIKGAVTKETAVKPEYIGEGFLVLEPTYKYIILQNVSKWGSVGMTIEDGMFLACDANVKRNIVARKTLSSAVLGGDHKYFANVPHWLQDGKYGFYRRTHHQNSGWICSKRRRPRKCVPRFRSCADESCCTN